MGAFHGGANHLALSKKLKYWICVIYSAEKDNALKNVHRIIEALAICMHTHNDNVVKSPQTLGCEFVDRPGPWRHSGVGWRARVSAERLRSIQTVSSIASRSPNATSQQTLHLVSRYSRSYDFRLVPSYSQENVGAHANCDRLFLDKRPRKAEFQSLSHAAMTSLQARRPFQPGAVMLSSFFDRVRTAHSFTGNSHCWPNPKICSISNFNR